MIGYIKEKLRDIIGKLWDIFTQPIEFIRNNYGIYLVKLMGILGLDYRLEYWIYLAK